MQIVQAANILNTLINDMQIGKSAVVNEDLSNLVDIGTEIIDFVDKNDAFDPVMRSLIDKVGAVIFVDRRYYAQAPDIVKTGWEYGSILQKVRCKLPKAQDNATWDLYKYPIVSGAAYPDPFELYKPDVAEKFFDRKVPYEIPMTFTYEQLKSAFTSAAELGSFFSMIENSILTKQAMNTQGLIMATINTLIAQKIHSGKNVVNLLADYNAATGNTLKAANYKTDPDFARFCSMTMQLYVKYIQEASMLYNNGGYVNFTPRDRMKIVMLSEFIKSLETYLYSSTFHNEFVKLEGYEEVGSWQGTGTKNEERSKIDITILTDPSTNETAEVTQEGVVGVIFDEWAAVVSNQNYRTTSIYNPRGEYTNYFYKYDGHFIVDTDENAIVFIIADPVI